MRVYRVSRTCEAEVEGDADYDLCFGYYGSRRLAEEVADALRLPLAAFPNDDVRVTAYDVRTVLPRKIEQVFGIQLRKVKGTR